MTLTYSPHEVINHLRQRDLLDLATGIAKAHQCTLLELVGTRKTAAFCAARHELWAALYATGHWSYPRIAELFHRDHTTIMDGVAKVRRRAA